MTILYGDDDRFCEEMKYEQGREMYFNLLSDHYCSEYTLNIGIQINNSTGLSEKENEEGGMCNFSYTDQAGTTVFYRHYY